MTKINIWITWIRIATIILIFITTTTLPSIYLIVLLIIFNTLLCLEISTWTSVPISSILLFLVTIKRSIITFLYFSSSSHKIQQINKIKASLIFINLVIWFIFILLTFCAPLTILSPTPELVYLIYKPKPFYIYGCFSAPLLFDYPLLFSIFLNVTLLLISIILFTKKFYK